MGWEVDPATPLRMSSHNALKLALVVIQKCLVLLYDNLGPNTKKLGLHTKKNTETHTHKHTHPGININRHMYTHTHKHTAVYAYQNLEFVQENL